MKSGIIAILVALVALFLLVAVIKVALKLVVIGVVLALAVGAYFAAERLIGPGR